MANIFKDAWDAATGLASDAVGAVSDVASDVGHGAWNWLEDNAHKLPVVGGFFENPAQKEHERQFRRMADRLAQYRPIAHDARMRAINQLMSYYAPANEMLSLMGLPTTTTRAQSPFPGGRPPT